MDFASAVVVSLTALLLIALLTERVSFDALGVLLMAALVITGVLDLERAVEGFANPAVITIACLYVVGEGLSRTGAVEFVTQLALRLGGSSEARLVILIGLITGSISAFLNDTAVVAVMIPVLLRVAQDSGIAASRLLMPMAFAALLGGMCTLIGTSTNLLVSGVASQLGQEPLGMFELTPVGILIAISGLLFMALFGKLLLPKRRSLAAERLTNVRTYVTELRIGPTSPLLGQPYPTTFGEDGPKVLFVLRDEETLQPPLDEVDVQEGDLVIFEGSVAELTGFQTKLGLKMVGGLHFDPRKMLFFELAVTHRSSAIGRRVEDLHLHRDLGCVVVAVLRHDQELRERASRQRLRAGDLLLVCGDDEARARAEGSTDFFLLTGAHHQMVLRQHARRALWIAASVIALFAIGSLTSLPAVPPPAMVAMLGAVAMVATGCVTARRAYRAVDWPIVLFIVGAMALGQAMKKTAVAGQFASGFVDVFDGFGTAGVIGALVALAIVTNAFVSHSAVALLLTPIALEMAVDLGVDARPFLLAVAYGGSAAFATPLGHQVSLMVYTPGGYRFTDFVRLGVPLCVVTWAVATASLSWMAN